MKTEPPCRTHMFLSVAHMFTDHHTHLRMAQVWNVLLACASQKSSVHNMFHRPLLDVPDPFPSFCSTPPPTTPTSLLMTGIRRSPCATPHGGNGVGGRLSHFVVRLHISLQRLFSVGSSKRRGGGTAAVIRASATFAQAVFSSGIAQDVDLRHGWWHCWRFSFDDRGWHLRGDGDGWRRSLGDR